MNNDNYNNNFPYLNYLSTILKEEWIQQSSVALFICNIQVSDLIYIYI